MTRLQRTLTGLAAATALVVLAGCGGYGFSLRNNNSVNYVSIQNTSGTQTLQVRQAVGLTLVAVTGTGGQHYSNDVPVVWSLPATNPAGGQLFEADCATTYGGEPLTTICFKGLAASPTMNRTYTITGIEPKSGTSGTNSITVTP